METKDSEQNSSTHSLQLSVLNFVKCAILIGWYHSQVFELHHEVHSSK